MKLRDYKKKRRLDASNEPDDAGSIDSKEDAAESTRRPSSKKRANSKKRTFVVQLHDASRRHFDFRLEVGGVLRSWAVPKGPSLRPTDKRLAVEVEDHPLAYAQFEGDIPQGHYGAGHVDIFDHGTWTSEKDPASALKQGELTFVLEGEKLHGAWTLVRTRLQGKQQQWLLIKKDDEFAADVEADDLVEETPTPRSTKKAKATPGSTKKAKPTPKAKSKSSEKPTKKTSSQRRWRERASALDRAREADFPREFSPELTTLRQHAPRGDEWVHEVKWDGYRLLTSIDDGRVLFRSRSGLDWSDKFPEIAEEIAGLGLNQARLDGELVALDGQGRSDFSELVRALKSSKPERLAYVLFDVPALEGVDLSACALVERKAILNDLIAQSPRQRLVYSEHLVGRGPEVFAATRETGVEGIVSKRADSPYEQRRSESWIKVKHEATDEFWVVGFTAPRGARTGIGALLLGRGPAAQYEYVGKVGTGFDDEMLRELREKLRPLERKDATVELPAHAKMRASDVTWVEPRLVVEVALRGYGSEGLLRQASFKRLREDKSQIETPKTLAKSSRSRSQPSATKQPTHPERVVFPDLGITKKQVFNYYRAVAPLLLPELARRPLSLLRCPSGITGQKFFQKHPSGDDEVRSVPIRQKSGTEMTFYVEDESDLLELVQRNALEFHPWGSRVDEPELPDRLVFDLDPGDGVAWPDVIHAAFDLRERLERVELESFVRLSGGKGLHVVVPIERGPSWDAVKNFCEAFSRAAATEQPTKFVATMSRAKRPGKIFIDWLRNGRGSTSVTGWSLRARPEAPVAMPLEWEELEETRSSIDFSLADAMKRCGELKRDPFERLRAVEQSLPTWEATGDVESS